MLSRHAQKLRSVISPCSQPICCGKSRQSPSLLRPPFAQSLKLAPQRQASTSASSTRWKARQAQDPFARDAKVQGLKSRAAFKLLQINDRHRIFGKGDTVVDLGFAPGSWSQVAANRTAPRGRVIGVDLLPAQPPRGVSSIQGDFLSPEVQAEVRAYVLDVDMGRPSRAIVNTSADEAAALTEMDGESNYIESSRLVTPDATENGVTTTSPSDPERMSRAKRDEAAGRVVDVVLSDMGEPWDQTAGFGSKSVSNAYRRMMSTSGISFKDHVGSMDLCSAALSFSFDTLRTGGHFVCKFYQGAEDKILEKKLRRLFEKVHRDKPSASRSDSREGFFVALRRKEAPTKDDVFAD